MNTQALCRSCGAPIIWCQTVTGKKMPVDEKPNPNGNLILDGECDCIRAVYVEPGTGTHTSHFATCPHAGLHRRYKKQGSLPGIG